MAYPTTARRTIVFKTRWDSILLVVAAGAVTFGLAATIHSRVAGRAPATDAAWTGDLTYVEPVKTAPALPLTSASLVVPRSELALPQAPVRTLMKVHGGCGTLCGAHATTTTPVPVTRTASEGAMTATHAIDAHSGKPTLMFRLNPLNHLPDVSKISRPFAMAGDTVQGWFKRF